MNDTPVKIYSNETFLNLKQRVLGWGVLTLCYFIIKDSYGIDEAEVYYKEFQIEFFPNGLPKDWSISELKVRQWVDSKKSLDIAKT